MTPEIARERVAKGAAHLDQVKPGWAWTIDPGTLDLASQCFCVLGQVFGTYTAGASALPRPFSGSELGFDVKMNDFEGGVVNMEAAFHLLQDAWIEQIADRILVVPAFAPSTVQEQGR